MPDDLDDPSAIDPDAVAAQVFTKARKGLDPDEVRAFLVDLASQIRESNRLAEDQQQRLVELERRNADPRDLDEDTITELVGEETTRVLETARRSAKEMRSKAEEAAAETTVAADLAAAKTRSDAEVYASELRQNADEDTARLRAEADSYAQGQRTTADEETTQQRADADAYAAEARGSADREIEELRAASETEVAALRGAAETVLAERTGDADVEASSIRTAAEEYAEQVRSDADRHATETKSAADTYAADHRGEADAVLSQANADAARLTAEVAGQVKADRARAAAEAADRHQQAEDDADALILDAREQGRTMVQEARTYRERVIADLADRRREARGDLEDLAATRDALAVTLTDVVDDVEASHRRLQSLTIDPRVVGDGSDDRAALPDVVTRPPVAVGELDDPAPSTDPASTADAAEEPSSGFPEDEGDAPAVVGSDATPDPDPEPTPEPTPEPGGEPADAEIDPGAAIDAEDAQTEAEQTDVAPVEADPVEGHEPIEPTGAADSPSDADDIFARLRADQEQPATDAPGPDSRPADDVDQEAEVAGSAADEAGTEPDAATTEPAAAGDADDDDAIAVDSLEGGRTRDDADLLDLRDATTDEVERQLGRRLKRVLSDEQNEALDLLRRSKGSPKADEVLPGEQAHLDRYGAAAQEDLATAERAGAGFFGDAPARAADVSDVATEFATDLVRQIRGRLERAFDDGGDEQETGERIRSVYREWKTQRIADAARHYVLVAFSRGVAHGATDGDSFRWLVDDGDAPCPDCDDNALAGSIPTGESYPTGDLWPPAHPGCRCLAVPASSA